MCVFKAPRTYTPTDENPYTALHHMLPLDLIVELTVLRSYSTVREP